MSGLMWYFVALVVAAASMLIWWGFPLWQMRDLRKRLAPEIKNGTIKEIEIEKLGDDYRKTVTQALGGVIVLIGAYVAYLQWEETRRSVINTDLNSLFSKGYDLLGQKNNVPQQVGGINALRSWARSNQQIYLLLL